MVCYRILHCGLMISSLHVKYLEKVFWQYFMKGSNMPSSLFRL